MPAKAAFFLNKLEDKCSFKKFYANMYKLLLAEFGITKYTKPVQKEKTLTTYNIYAGTPPSDGSISADAKEKTAYNFSFADPALAEMIERQTALFAKKGKKVFSFTFRSPESMVRYVGDIVALQLHKGGYIPKVYIGRGQEADILIVRRGPANPSSTAISVVDSNGQEFFIPKPDYSVPTHDLSLQTISIVADVLNGAVSAKSLPQVSTFTLTPPAP
ncbi:MAG: hypothetical protein WBX25_20300 [Rhodomicrobium sp.]